MQACTSIEEIILDCNIIMHILIDFDYELQRVLEEEHSLKYNVTTVILQGEAGVGKSSLKSLILSLPYHDVSTDCIEAPKFAVKSYATTDDNSWKLVKDDEFDVKHIAELQDLATNDNKTQPQSQQESSRNFTVEESVSTHQQEDIDTRNKHQPVSDTSDNYTAQTLSNATESKDLQPAAKTNTHNILAVTENNARVPSSGDTENEVTKQRSFELDELFKKKVSCTDKFSDYKWLYLIDSGGQVQFQKLLFAFMPRPSVLILVINLTKDLSETANTVMTLEGGEKVSFSGKPLSIENMLKQVLSAVASNENKSKDEDFFCFTKKPKQLRVITVGTHRDKLNSWVRKILNFLHVCSGKPSVDVCLKKICEPLKNTCDCFDENKNFVIYKIDGSMAKEIKCVGESTSRIIKDEALKKIKQLLESQTYEVVVPLRWHLFCIILRKEVKEKGCGVLKKSHCKDIGRKKLGMEDNKVDLALQYFHKLKMLFYYHDSPAKDVVFVELSSLIDIIRELVIDVGKRDLDICSEDVKGMATCGYLSIKTLEDLESYKKISKEVNAKTILDLFVSLKIACKLPKAPEWLCEDEAKEEWFLMPVLLPAKNVTVKSGLFCFRHKSSSIPLLFYFENAVPMGLFCAVIVQLCSNGWQMVHKNQKGYSNLFYLETSAEGQCLRVTFVEQLNCIEIHCDTLLDKRILTRKKIEEDVKGRLDNYKYAFYCPCCEGVCHVEEKSTTIIKCDKSHQSYELIDLHDYEEYLAWFKSDKEIKKLLQTKEEKIMSDEKRRKHKQGRLNLAQFLLHFYIIIFVGKCCVVTIGLFIFILLLVFILLVLFQGSSNYYQDNGIVYYLCCIIFIQL